MPDPALILRRANLSRNGGEWQQEDLILRRELRTRLRRLAREKFQSINAEQIPLFGPVLNGGPAPTPRLSIYLAKGSLGPWRGHSLGPPRRIVARVSLMRDWLLVLAPVAAITYFLVYPDQFRSFMAWCARLLH
jgi:hypothetical protein